MHNCVVVVVVFYHKGAMQFGKHKRLNLCHVCDFSENGGGGDGGVRGGHFRMLT